jgi:hypothetical protein
MVGPNGGGKSTVLEALRATATTRPVSFPVGSRNAAGGDAVDIAWWTDEGDGRIASVRSGSSETHRGGTRPRLTNLVHLPSRRTFNPYFGQSVVSREDYSGGYPAPVFRGQSIDHFAGRLFQIERSDQRQDFDALVTEIVGTTLDWSIDQQDSGQYFLKIPRGGGSHSSDGLGEGTVSALFLVDALYDSQPGDIIVIDEPELSLHPIHQRRLARVLSRYSSDRQVIVATHSPYFIGWGDLLSGGKLVRIHLDDTMASTISQAPPEVINALGGVASDIQNPHVLGLNAAEVFFLEDRVILTEGQEDVVVYQALAAELGVQLAGTMFGWGVGGAEKMTLVVQLLHALGYRAVVGILDGNKADVAERLRTSFVDYHFFVIPADDVRSKPARQATPEIAGLTDRGGAVRSEHRDAVSHLFAEVNAALTAK